MKKGMVIYMSIKGRIHSFESFGAVDGPGIRFVVFLQGCPLRCLYCHNPDSWDPAGGSEMEAEELVAQIVRYKNFIRTGGVTLSGGEPLMQTKFSQKVLELCKAEGIHTAIDTSGCFPLEFCKGAVDAADMLLLDIKAIDDALAKEISGTGNQNPLKLLDYCESVGKPVWIRHVLLPGRTLDKQQMHKMGAYLQKFKCVEQVELLPFHKIGEYKWHMLGIAYTLGEVPAPNPEEVAEMKAILESYGLKTS